MADLRSIDNESLAALRKDYTQKELTELDVNSNPIFQFDKWFSEALSAKANEPNAMSCATADTNGRPSVRVVLLKSFDEKGFVFYTNYTSKKAQDLEQNPQACLNFFWVELERQVRISGRVEKISKAESLKYFLSRPYGSQLGAWVSHQSQVITNRSLLETKWAQMKNKFKEGQVPLPDFWGGFRVVPDEIEFWQGRSSRLHDRILYIRDSKNEWTTSRLSP